VGSRPVATSAEEKVSYRVAVVKFNVKNREVSGFRREKN